MGRKEKSLLCDPGSELVHALIWKNRENKKIRAMTINGGDGHFVVVVLTE